MLINLTEYFDCQGKQAKIKVPYEADIFNDGIRDYKVLSSEDVELSITYVSEGKLEIKGEGRFTLEGNCDRCLKPVNIDVPVAFEYPIIKPDGFHEFDEEDQWFVKGYELDAEALINNEMIMSLPMKVLCDVTCKGLCPVCGNNLNDGECGCDTFVPDPRMAAISDIFNAIKEV